MTDIPRYSLAALSKEIAEVASASEGSRNVTLNSSAFSLGTLVAAGQLDQKTVEKALYDAARAAGMPAREARSTIRSGLTDGMKAPRVVPETSARVIPFAPPSTRASVGRVYWNTDEAPRNTQRACEIWRKCFGPFDADTPQGRYLLSRGIEQPWPSMLAAGRLQHPDTGENVATLIVARHCPVVRLVRGIQRIFLTDDGAKYAGGTVKMSLGSIDGGRSELIRPDAELLVCEGVESALAAWKLFDLPAWAICGGFPEEMTFPQRVRIVRLVADNDANGGSLRKAKALARSIRASGRLCYVHMPEEPCSDANTVLLKKGTR